MDIFFHADDYGRSAGVNKNIVDTIDNGVTESVSMLVNMAGYTEAVSALRERAGVKGALHFNLTEGRALSAPIAIQTLVDDTGHFIHTPFSLARAYYLAGTKKRRIIRSHIRHEFTAQLTKLRTDLQTSWRVRVDGHNHIHMLPFILDEITDALGEYDVEYIRLVREPLYLSGAVFAPRTVFKNSIGYLRVVLMNTLATFNRTILKKKCIPHNSLFVGIFATGSMNNLLMRNAFAALGNRRGTAEILFHPGGAAVGEEGGWHEVPSVFREWYFSPDRRAEQQTLISSEFNMLAWEYRAGRFTPSVFSETVSAHLGQIVRFAATGALAAFVHLSTLYVFTEFVGMWYVASSAVGFGLGFVVSFSLQKFWTFEDHETDGIHGQAFGYFFLQLLGLMTNLIGIYVLVDVFGMWYMLSQLIILIVVAVVVFMVSKFFIFNTPLRRRRA